MNFLDRPSPNFDERADGAKPEMIILHYTGMASAEAALRRLSDPAAKVSCHYLIDERGDVHRLVDEDKRAWHAGVSGWRGKGDVNSRSIGIELSNRNGEPYTEAQLSSLVSLCRELMQRHGITPENVQGHSDIAPDRKQDPGQHFPWRRLAALGVGVWPQPTLKDFFNAAAFAEKPRRLKKLFKLAGYPVDGFGQDKPSLDELVAAFQRHHEPAAFAEEDGAGRPTENTVARLRALIRRKPT